VEIQTGEFERFLGCLGAKWRPLCGSFQLAQGKNESGIHLTFGRVVPSFLSLVRLGPVLCAARDRARKQAAGPCGIAP
jgi:hypothetical protein